MLVVRFLRGRSSSLGSLNAESSSPSGHFSYQSVNHDNTNSEDKVEGEMDEYSEEDGDQGSSVDISDRSDTDKSEERSSPKKGSKRIDDKKWPLSPSDRLAARAAAVAKRSGRPIQNEGRNVQHDAVGSVTIRTYTFDGEGLEFGNRPSLASVPPPPNALRLFLEYMDPRTVARCARTSPEWHRECYAKTETGKSIHPAYAGVHFMELESSFVACENKIDGMFFHQPARGDSGQLFTSGQRSVSAWRRLETPKMTPARESAASQDGSRASIGSAMRKGATEHGVEASWKMVGVAVRDTAPFTKIRPVNNSFVCCSSNGSIREWSMAHDVKNIRFLAQMREHHGRVTDVAFAAPSASYCKIHGAPAHSCYLYSVSDDRSLKVWDMSSKKCLHTIKPQVSDCGTLQSVAISDFHLYAGTSNGRIIIFALERVCLRRERHACHLHDEPRWFCEQETLKHGEEPVQHMVCGGTGGKCKYLFTAARNGTMKVWNVPEAKLGHGELRTFRQHKRAITALAITDAHLFSASDEGHVRIWSLGTLELQRIIAQKWRIKCIWVHHAPAGSPEAGKGTLFLGLATGSVLTYPITDAV